MGGDWRDAFPASSFRLVFYSFQEAECAYTLFVVATFWVTEALPLSVTALLPALMFPLFGIMPSKKVSSLANVCHNICFMLRRFVRWEKLSWKGAIILLITLPTWVLKTSSCFSPLEFCMCVYLQVNKNKTQAGASWVTNISGRHVCPILPGWHLSLVCLTQQKAHLFHIPRQLFVFSRTQPDTMLESNFCF